MNEQRGCMDYAYLENETNDIRREEENVERRAIMEEYKK